MTDVKALADGLKRGDMKLLHRIVETNGGGVNSGIVPKAQRERLIKAGLVRWKGAELKQPWNRLTVWGQLIHTREGLELSRAELARRKETHDAE